MRQGPFEARPSAQVVVLGISVRRSCSDRLGRIVPQGDEAPFESVHRTLRFDVVIGPRARPEHRISSCQLEEEVLVYAALIRGLSAAGEEVLDEIPSQQGEDHHWDGGGEVVTYARVAGIGLEYVDVHAEEAADEGEREENECDPAGAKSVDSLLEVL